MKVLHLIDSGGLYGAETMLLTLAKAQEKLGLDVTIGSLSNQNGSKAIEVRARSEGLKVQVFSVRRGMDIKSCIKIVEWAGREKIDVMHCHTYKDRILLALVSYFKPTPKLVTTLHGWTQSSNWRLGIYYAVDRLLLPRFDHLFAVSNETKNRVGLKERIGVIHNPIPEVSNFPVADRIKAKIGQQKQQGKHILGTVGRLSHEKGYDFLIESFSPYLLNEGWSLVIVGDGPLVSTLEALALRLGVQDNILFTGYLDNAASVISEFDVYINSSRTEGIPITILEALSRGVRVVASKVGGIPELACKLGLPEQVLFEFGDGGALVAAVDTSLKLDYHHYSQRARELFSSEAVAVQYLTAYRYII